MNAITCTGVSKSFGEVQAVDTLDLEVCSGETVALLGPNGAGKTTAISMLLGLALPDTGRIEVLGGSADQAVTDGRIGAMLQEGSLITGLTVKELIDFVRRLYPTPLPLGEVLELTGLTDIAGRRADRLSGGQTQLVRYALSIAGAPQLLVLDEPTAAMDVESRRAFWASMQAYAAEGRTIVFATHYLEEADENADRIVIIARGRVIADGTPTEIRAMSGPHCIIFTLGDQPSVGLDRLPGVISVDIRGANAELRTDNLDATLRALYYSGLDVRNIEVIGADLEDAFVTLTTDI
jgi:ABC-2 type transport system ATP-binding protein